MHFTTAAIALAAFASSAYAHMEMTNPIPLRSKLNKNSPNPDFSMTTPLSASGSDFPCKGYLKDIGTPAGVSTASWPAGSPQKLGITGGAAHNGGSCQLSLSYDGGKTFKVIKSIEGGCVNPAGGDHTFDFTVPTDAKSGDAIFSWTWFNNTGNREMYMNCAAVTITGSGTSTLADRPDMMVANVGNGCAVPDGTDVKFPNPGADLQVISQAKLGAPTGTCGSSGPSAPSAPAPPSPADPAPPAASSPAVPPPAASSPASPPPAASSPAAPPAASSSAALPVASSAPAPSLSAPAPPSTNPAGTTYTVKVGDVCTTIAAKNGITVAQLMKNNSSINTGCTNLTVGQSISLRRRSRIMREYH